MLILGPWLNNLRFCVVRQSCLILLRRSASGGYYLYTSQRFMNVYEIGGPSGMAKKLG